MPLFVDNGKPLADFASTIEVACSGLARVEFMGNGQACFVLYRNAIAAGAGLLEQQVCARIYAPLAAAPEAAELLVKAAIEGGIVAAASLSTRLLM